MAPETLSQVGYKLGGGFREEGEEERRGREGRRGGRDSLTRGSYNTRKFYEFRTSTEGSKALLRRVTDAT